MKKCPYCGKENNDQNTNCEKCLAGLPVEKKQEEKEPVKAQKQGVKKHGS